MFSQAMLFLAFNYALLISQGCGTSVILCKTISFTNCSDVAVLFVLCNQLVLEICFELFECGAGQWCDPLTLLEEQSGGVVSKTGMTSSLERHADGSRTRLGSALFLQPQHKNAGLPLPI